MLVRDKQDQQRFILSTSQSVCGGSGFLLLLFDLAESIKVLIDSVLWNVWGWSDQTFMNYLRNIQPWLGGQFKVSWILLSKLILCAKIDLAKITKLWLIQCCEVFGVVSGQPVMAEDQMLGLQQQVFGQDLLLLLLVTKTLDDWLRKDLMMSRLNF